MTERWHYKHEGAEQGPVSLAKLESLAAIGALLPTDPVWREGEDARRAVEALSVLDIDAFRKTLNQVDEALANAPKAPVATPGWMSETSPGAGVEAQPSTPNAAPDWLGDVQTAPSSMPMPPSPAAGPKPMKPRPLLPPASERAKVAPAKLPPIVLKKPAPPEEETEEEIEDEPFEFKRRDLIMFVVGGAAVAGAIAAGFYFATRAQRHVE